MYLTTVKKASSGQMRTTSEKLVHHVRTIHGIGISKTLLNKNTVIILKPEHTQDTLDEYQLSTERRNQSHHCLAKARQSQKEVFEDQFMEGEPTISTKDQMSLAILNN